MTAAAAAVVPNVDLYRDLINFLVRGAPAPHIVLSPDTAPPALAIDLMSSSQLQTILISTGVALLALVAATVVATRGVRIGPATEQGPALSD